MRTSPIAPARHHHPSRPVRRGLAALGGLVLAVGLTPVAVVPAAAVPPVPAGAPPASAAPASAAADQPRARRVLAISIDALNPAALRQVGRDGAPYLWQLADEGASTFNARTAYELTDTLPNHTTMVTGRPIDADAGGHGVTWNDERLEPRTVQEAAGHPTGSVFGRVHRAGGSTAVFSTKTKLSLFDRSWPRAVDRSTIASYDDDTLSRKARRDLVRKRRDLTFVHFGLVDHTGHKHGFLSEEYLDAVREVDGYVGRLVRAVENRRRLRGTVIVLTADHGGKGESHRDPTRLANYRVPFVVWGRGVRAGHLYPRNPDFTAPGRRRVPYDAQDQPIRNGMVANLSLGLLGLRPVPGSAFDHGQDLRVG